MSNENQSESPDPAALLKQLIAAPGGVDVLRQLFGAQPGPAVGMPMHPDDIRAAHAKISTDLERRHREHVAKSNRTQGHPEPHAGDVFYAWLTKSVRSGIRTREGINFEPGQSVKIEVVDDGDLEAARAAGVKAVTVDGMERVFEDDTLVINRDPMTIAAGELATERARADAAQRERDALRVRVAELEADARRNAPESTDGSPTRLKAAAKARAEAETQVLPEGSKK